MKVRVALIFKMRQICFCCERTDADAVGVFIEQLHVSCPQVVYSSSARELKVETVKPDTPEKEEDDIDIDAIWETRVMMLFLTCGFDSRCPALAKWLAFSLLYYLSHHQPSLRSLLRLVAWFNIALYLLHINAVILKCIQLMKWSLFWGF